VDAGWTNGEAEARSGGDIITRQRYANFELVADFKCSPGCNSGIKIFVQPDIWPIDKVTGKPTGKGSAIGMEFQILDDQRHPDARLGRDGDRTIGSLYDLIPPAPDKKVMPIGEWNHARILSQGNHVEFWLNGRKTLEFERGSPAFRGAVAMSKFKNIPDFGEWPDGHILLQEHGSEVSFRNIKLRELPAARAVPENQGQLVRRFRALEARAGSFGPDYEPIYRAALAWYPAWGNHTNDPADTWFVAPDEYAAEFAGALEQGQNFIAGRLGSSFPLAFEKTLPDGAVVKANYQLNFPEGFPEKGRKFPLIIGLHGSGWLGHKISYVRGGKTGGRAFQVTPINEGGPWKLDFLNAYLDELLRILPVDPDRVYVEGHSLGAMATWDWAMNNPARFAAISPRDGTGSPFRASRLQHIPVWVVHGADDDVIPPAYSDQMVCALQAAGGTVKYSLLKGAPHNLPRDFDEQAVVTWYLQQTRSHAPPPADPLDSLGLRASGVSEPVVITLPGGWFWRSDTVPWQNGRERRSENSALEKALFRKVQALGALVDSPVFQEINVPKQTLTFWLKVPDSIHSEAEHDASIATLPERRAARFYARGDARKALDYAATISAEFKAEGKLPTGAVWLAPLTPWRRGTNNINECWIELQ
jgi:hypothetical protein